MHLIVHFYVDTPLTVQGVVLQNHKKFLIYCIVLPGILKNKISNRFSMDAVKHEAVIV